MRYQVLIPRNNTTFGGWTYVEAPDEKAAIAAAKALGVEPYPGDKEPAVYPAPPLT